MEHRDTIIGDMETFAIFMLISLWGDRLHSSQLVIYIDNEGAKFSLIKGYWTQPYRCSLCIASARVD